jgi:hypothetical protein
MFLGLDSTDAGFGPVAGSCELYTEPSGPMKGGQPGSKLAD